MKRHVALQDLSRDHHDFLVFCQAAGRGEVTDGRRVMMQRRVADHAAQEASLAATTGLPCPAVASMDTLREHVRACERQWFEAIQDSEVDLGDWHRANVQHRRTAGLAVGRT